MKLDKVEKQTTRHGKVVWYYRPSRERRIRIFGEYGSPEFAANYERVKARDLRMLQRPARDRKQAILRDLLRKFDKAKRRDLARGFTTSITAEWIGAQLAALDYCCAVTGLPFAHDKGSTKTNPFSPSLDRIDNRKGYETDNVRIVLYAVNTMMLDWGDAVFDQIVMAYVLRRLQAAFPCTHPQKAPHPSQPIDNARLYRKMVGPAEV